MSSRRRTVAAVGVVGAATAVLAIGSAPGTYAALSDFGTVGVSVTAGYFQDHLLDSCGDLSNYASSILVAGPGDTPVPAGHGNESRIVVVTYDGTVDIEADNGDCIVTGPGTTNVYNDVHALIVLGTGSSNCTTSNINDKNPKFVDCVAGNQNGSNGNSGNSGNSGNHLNLQRLTIGGAAKPVLTPSPTSTPTADPSTPSEQPSTDTTSATGTPTTTTANAASTDSTEGGQS